MARYYGWPKAWPVPPIFKNRLINDYSQCRKPLSTFSFQLVPNPTSEQVTLDLRLRRNAKVSFQIFTNAGQLVLATTEEERAEGPCSIRVDCQSWDNGWYVAVLSVDGAIFKKSFLIQKEGDPKVGVLEIFS